MTLRPTKTNETPEMRALKRAAKSAWNHSLRTNTPFYIWKNGQVVDATKHLRDKKRKKD